MLHLGFSEIFVKIIMSCVTSISYSVLLNGEPTGNIKPSRGLHQGDPFSPYLFLICAMGLQGLLHKAESEGHLRGVSICRNGPRVSHLFFADDSVLFCRATKAECQIILDVLSIYEKGSGQKINKDKTCIFFSSNTEPELQTCIQQVLAVPAIRQYEKYLGMPAFVGRAKKQSFIYIKEDKWLPDPCYRKVSSPLPSIPPEAKVSSLIDRNSETWKKEDIKQLFLPHEADAIIGLPLSLRMPTDWLVWSKTPSGNFSSRSAYRLLASNASATNPSSSNPIP